MTEGRNLNRMSHLPGRRTIPELYVVTDTVIGRGRSHAEIAAAASAGGAGIIQLRDKHLAPEALLREAVAVREALSSSDALFVVNDSLDVAIASCADGVHLGQSDGSVTEARAAAEAAAHVGFLIGVSVGCVEEAFRAVDEGADYVALGPVFSTTSKEDAGAARGLLILREIREALSTVPLVAIGGIGPANVQDVFRAGADSAAVISAVVGQDDVAAAARGMVALIERVRGPGVGTLR
ncbi:thiamine phosphate synthase [Methanogenium sp. S4BF]|uniref:thiamine phosphate synthase n=1 Tax=Methanogenium sp. S4BF TaxID=1789226 RepID=UPI0024162A7C|nr:thiamine phosphate synthase [Methanogenium sp. S4BF]WFN34153.1 thiamine phosphate synthase [Methanogenium sp. S4BF]